MPDGQTPATSSPTSAEGAATQGGQEAPLTKGELESVVASLLDTKLRGLQSGTDRQIAQVRTEMAQRMQTLAEELGTTAEGLLEASAADPETRQAIGEKLTAGRQAAQARSGEFAQRMAYMETALQQAGLTEEDLKPHTLAQYIKHPDPVMFNEGVKHAFAKKPAPLPDLKMTAAEKRIADLETEIKRLKGEDDVPAGGQGAPQKAHKTADDWSRAELQAMMRARGLER